MELSTKGTLKVCKSRFVAYQKKMMERYAKNEWVEDSIVFPDEDYELIIESLAVDDSNHLFVAESSKLFIRRCIMTKNSVGIFAQIENSVAYKDGWASITSMACMTNQRLCLGHQSGISILNLTTMECLVNHLVNPPPLYMAAIRHSVLYTTGSTKVYEFSEEEGNNVFSGGEDSGSRDGTAQYCQYYCASGLAVEFNNVAYICDKVNFKLISIF